MKKKILITTGGSGGHVLSALTIYDHLKTEFDMLISSDQRGLKYFETEEYKPIIVDTPKLKISIFFHFGIFKVLVLIIKSLSILKKKKISILISTGGYMSLPLCFAAKILGVYCSNRIINFELSLNPIMKFVRNHNSNHTNN